ncbi:MAG: tyrosine-type recombinase/integrase [Beijerinckiaceae bacterium]|nr:tyrosine-type recombinase/integrase [Beijerinckiaceae bacterium]MCZ8301521.1 tyrosine-type recombinase/integrase [Beijerinckiaceae bacterium]
MAHRPAVKLTKRAVDAAQPETARFTLRDSDVKGFGLRVYPSGEKSWVIEYRPGEGGRGVAVRRFKIGSAHTLEADAARSEARRLLALVRLGQDPAGTRKESRKAETVEAVFETYEARGMLHLKASSRNLMALYFNKHILPRIGKKKLADVSREAVRRLHADLGATRAVTANRVIVALSGFYRYAEETGLVAEGFNPTKGIKPFPESPRERYLTSEELARLGDAIREAERDGIPWEPDPAKKAKHAPKAENRVAKIGEHAAAALRLLILTGCRLREILNLEWTHIDFERGILLLPDSKSGRKIVILNAPALDVLAKLPRLGRYVIAGESAGQENEKPRADLHRPWRSVARRAGLEGVRLHDLRHTFASFGAGGGMGLQIVGKLLGHKQPTTTQRYAHLADDPLRRASNAIGATLVAAMGEDTRPENVIPLSRGG